MEVRAEYSILVMPKGLQGFQKGESNPMKKDSNREFMRKLKKGVKLGKEHRRNIGLGHIGITKTQEVKDRISLNNRGKKHGRNKGWVMSEATKAKLRIIAKESKNIEERRVKEEAKLLEKEGYRCVVLTKCMPDIIALKDGKLIAVEVEYSYYPNYKKYTPEIKGQYDEVKWIIKNKNYSKNHDKSDPL